jgi:uncharacterized protein YggE
MQKAAIVLTAMAFIAVVPPAVAQTVLTIGASGAVSVAPDEAIASFVAQFSAPDAATAQATLNNAMAKALVLARAVPGVEATTGSYGTSQDASNDQPPKISYAAQESLTLSIPAAGGIPPARFSALLASLQQDGLLLNGLDGGLSAPAQAKAEQAAIAEAITNMQVQAQAIAAQLHERAGDVKTMSVNVTPWQTPFRGGFDGAVPMKAMAAAPPSSAPQDISASATITAEIELNSML